MAKALLLDLDGTLIDSRADLASAVNRTRRDLLLPPLEPAQIIGFVGEGVRKLLVRALPECPERLQEALVLNQGHYCAHLLDQTRLYPGVVESLDRLSQGGWLLAVVTNKPRPFTELILEGLGLTRLLSAVVAGGDCPQLKPDPAPLELALARCQSLAQDSWMAGDHFTDLQAGRKAGLRVCFCRYGFGDPRQEPWDLAVTGLPQLAEQLLAPIQTEGRPTQ